MVILSLDDSRSIRKWIGNLPSHVTTVHVSARWKVPVTLRTLISFSFPLLGVATGINTAYSSFVPRRCAALKDDNLTSGWSE